jgi:DNA-binding transcriptional LysR family regulator
MKFRMRDLENFLEVANCRTMQEAAKKLGITQPALSESIKRLEADLKEVLLYRSRTGITLTPAGRAARVHAKGALSLLSEVETIHDQWSSFGLRVITIGCHPTVASYCLPDALNRLRKVAPDYKISLKHDLSRNIQTSIQQGLVDVGIVVNPSPSPDLVIKKVGVDEVGVWAAHDGCDDRVFCNLELIQTQSILRKWKDQPVTKINTDSLELIARLAGAGLGYGVLPARAVQLLRIGLKPVDTSPVFQDSIGILHRPEFGKSNVERQVIQALQGGFK